MSTRFAEELIALRARSPSEIAHVIRGQFPTWVAANGALSDVDRVRLLEELAGALRGSSEDALCEMVDRYIAVGEEYRYYAADPVARAAARLFLDAMMTDLEVEGLDRAQSFFRAGGRRLAVCNHLSYADTQAKDLAFSKLGFGVDADSMTVVAGPKVYSQSFRRLAALGLNTIKTVQSVRLSHNDAGLSVADVGRIAIGTVHQLRDLMDAGQVGLLYPEGTRSRDGRLSSFFRAASRYLEGALVLPVALSGTENLFPIGADGLSPSVVRLSFGEPFEAGKDRVGALTRVHEAIASHLPETHRPHENTSAFV